MGMAWYKSAAYPWETARYVSGIEVIKVNITLRIYSAKWHVYAGLALLNPSAQLQIRQYSTSTTELFKLMVEGKEAELSARIWDARKNVFGWEKDMEGKEGGRAPILLSEDVLDQFSLGGTGNGGEKGRKGEAPNSHLSLLAMVDCWSKLGIRPFEHLDVAGTPVFMLWIGGSLSLSVPTSLAAPSFTTFGITFSRDRSRRVPVPLARTRPVMYSSLPQRQDPPTGRYRIRSSSQGMERVRYVWQL
jgi:hypothetical protein